jgi:hypothetical protein
MSFPPKTRLSAGFFFRRKSLKIKCAAPILCGLKSLQVTEDVHFSLPYKKNKTATLII